MQCLQRKAKDVVAAKKNIGEAQYGNAMLYCSLKTKPQQRNPSAECSVFCAPSCPLGNDIHIKLIQSRLLLKVLSGSLPKKLYAPWQKTCFYLKLNMVNQLCFEIQQPHSTIANSIFWTI